jgi:hypothetical protein
MASKRTEWILMGVGIVAVILLVLFVRHHAGPATTTVVKQTLPAAELPEKFPLNIPIDKTAPVQSNYTAQASTGGWQSTRTFTTTSSLDQNFALYKDYFDKDGWTIRASKNEADYKALLAIKDGVRAQVIINTKAGDTTGTNMVQISILTQDQNH